MLHSRDSCGRVEMPFHSLNECKVGFYLVATLEATVSNLVGDFGFMLQTSLAKLSHPPGCSNVVLPHRDCCKLHLGFEMFICLLDSRDICCLVHWLTICRSFGRFEDCIVIKRKEYQGFEPVLSHRKYRKWIPASYVEYLLAYIALHFSLGVVYFN
jgi:hypothetical protein